MPEVGIRALKQNASSVVAEAASGEIVTITDHGHPVAVMMPLPATPLGRLVASGRARPPRRSIDEIPAAEPGPPLTGVLEEQRSSERY